MVDADPGLDVTGKGQAQTAAASLMELAQLDRPTAVFTSPLRRCAQTAEPLAKLLGRPAVVEPAVAEIPTPSHLTAAERGPWLRQAFAAPSWSKIEGEVDYRLWRDRVAEAVGRHAGGAIFSHFVAINAAISAATGSEAVISFHPDHGSITVFEVEDGALTLIEQGRSAPTAVL